MSISSSPALEAFLLGTIEFDRALLLQQRLAAEARDRGDGQITLLLCEHPTIVTIGRGGSLGEVAAQNRLLQSRQVEVRWVNRGGGCLIHTPGQQAIYPIVPLGWHGFSVGQFLERFRAGLVNTLGDLNVHCALPANSERIEGVWGRTGQLAAFGVAVRHWVTYYGAYLNVCPPLGLFRLVEPPMSSLVAERCGSVKMTHMRAALVRRLAECFGCDRWHLYTGHPWLRQNDVRRANEP